MMIPFEGRGILVPVFIIGSFLGTTFLLMGVPELIFDYRIIKWIDFKVIAGISLLISGFLTTHYAYNYFEDPQGRKIKMNIVNSFCFIHMRYYGYFETGIGIAIILDGLYSTYLMHAQ